MGTFTLCSLCYQHNTSLHLAKTHTHKMPPKKSTAEKTDDSAPKEKKQNGLTKPMNLSNELAAIVGAKKGEKLARSEIVKRLWAYLKEKQLQDPENKQFFTPDELMRPVFGKERMRAFAMSKYLKEHLS